MKFKAGELLYPTFRDGVIGRCLLREQSARHYQYIGGGTPGVFIEYTAPQNFELNAVSAPRVLLLILVQDEQMLFGKGTWRRPEAKCK